jgi:excisionase family DNA binding protein
VEKARSLLDPILRDRTALVALIDAGLTIDEIAARAGCSRSTMRRTARRPELPPFKPGRRPTPMLVDRDARVAFTRV